MATKFITVSIEIMHDKKLSPNQKFILAEIEQLSSLEKGCIATNKHFSELIGITTQGVSKAINQLSSDGYISIDNSQTKRNFGRKITINSGVFTINSGKSAINSGLESKENITKNITIDEFFSFAEQLKKVCKYKTKVTRTKDGEKLFKQIEDKDKLFVDYIAHQEDKGNFAVRLTAFMEDYSTVYNKQEEATYSW